ncbi:hypothetical protein [Geothrix fuzhouensis]|uniref:hypothetical protein n=1 Tax=Geothrix fuzhouensis TaxID=2966451 RepID=UPI0021483E6A|nr:hypothetical protein [Geothrix fuzhouensis]
MPTKQNPGGHRGGMLTESVREQGKDGLDTSYRQPLRERMVRDTLPFLAVLFNCTEEEAGTRPFTSQVFDDTPRKDPKRAKILHGCLEELAEDLDARNAQGDGIFIAVNQTDLRGREKKNIITPRAAWADVDFKAAAEDAEPFDLAKLPLAPTMAVSSGHGVHLYWCFSEATPYQEGHQAEHEALLRGIQKVLAPFGADGQVCQVASVLRLPGFYNVKREPVLVEVIR